MPNFHSRSYIFKGGRVFNMCVPFEVDEASLRDLIKFLISEMGMSSEDIKKLLRRDLGFTPDKADEEINNAMIALDQEADLKDDSPSLEI